MTPSHYSRPRVSDDNPFSESLFKTIKYDLACPQRFDSLEHTRTWVAAFMHRYANDHRHSGLGHYTPAAVFHGTAPRPRPPTTPRPGIRPAPRTLPETTKASALPGPTGINTKTQAALSQTA